MKWEYLNFKYTINSNEEFNNLGQQEWELVGVSCKNEYEGIAYFKRPKTEIQHTTKLDKEELIAAIKDIEDSLASKVNKNG